LTSKPVLHSVCECLRLENPNQRYAEVLRRYVSTEF
jgi:hypothetical protein